MKEYIIVFLKIFPLALLFGFIFLIILGFAKGFVNQIFGITMPHNLILIILSIFLGCLIGVLIPRDFGKK